MHNFILIPTAIIPQWTKSNVPFYSLALFSNDGAYVVMDDAHPESTYKKWLGPNYSFYEQMIAQSVKVTADEFKAMRNDSKSAWYAAPEV